MRYPALRVPLAVCLLLAALPAPAQEARWRDQFQIIEREAEADGSMSMVANSKDTGVQEDSELGQFLRLASYDKWKVFEDEHVRFSYPDFPGMKVAALSQADQNNFAVYGGPVSSTDHSAALIYRIAVGKVTWAFFLLQKADWLDEGICLCGQVVIDVLLPHDGCLYDYSLLESGNLKKMQVLGDGWRLQSFEWTHLPLSQGMFLQLAESVQLKHPLARTESEWRAAAAAHSDRLPYRLGWLRRGQTAEQIRAVLGAPARESGSELVYESVDKEILWKSTAHVPLKDGKFAAFTGDWRQGVEIPPDRGTLAWALRLYHDDPITNKPSKPTKADVQLAMELFFKEAPNASGHDWAGWCQVAYTLAEHGKKDARVVPLVKRRFLDPEQISQAAALILDSYKVRGAEELFRKRIRITFDGAARSLDKKYLIGTPYDDLHNLIVFLDAGRARAPFVREALAHPHPCIRDVAYSFLRDLPDDEAHQAARDGLEKGDDNIRFWSAVTCAERFSNPSDLAFLEGKLGSEKDERVREWLTKAIEKTRGKTKH